MAVTRALARYVARTGFRDHPEAAVHLAKRAILDTVGVTLAGTRHRLAAPCLGFLDWTGGAPQAAVLGTGRRASVPDAAWANGTFGHALDYDDVNWTMWGHPSVTVLPPALALGEALGASGAAVLNAYLVGFEVAAKVGAGTVPALVERGWHPTGILGAFGAAAAAATLLGLDEGRASCALGLAASSGGTIRAQVGTMAKPFHAGQAARAGVVAAKLAASGFTAAADALEHELGFVRAYCGDAPADLAKIGEAVGDPPDILAHGVAIKRYPCCSEAHPAIDAMLELAAAHRIAAPEVEAIEVGVNPIIAAVLSQHAPESGAAGMFSMEYCMAAALLDRRVGLGQFSDARARDPELRSLLGRVRMYVRPDLADRADAFNLASLVTVRLRDGRVLRREVKAAKGTPANPLSESELTEKFRACADGVLPSAAVEEAIDRLLTLERQPSIAPLAAVLLGVGAPPREPA
jgi:2-methylcitrate dehydratase PrpD